MIDKLSELLINIEDDYVYIRMMALTWVANYGLKPQMVQSSSGKLLAEIIQYHESEKIIIVNFYGIVSIDDHSLDYVSKVLKITKRKMVAINASQVLNLIDNYIRIKPKQNPNDSTIIFNSSNDQECNDATAKVLKIENNIIRNIVKNSYEKFSEMTRLRSTPVYASGIFNARKIVSNRKNFIWICLLMSEKLTKIMDEYKPRSSRLLAVSLRASPFAGALGLLGSIDIEIVDHMGPYLKILEGYSLRINQEEINYIYIGDFILFGTELKIAETYVAARNCIIDHALVIGSLFDSEDYQYKDKKQAKVHSLVKLTDARSDVKYEIERKDA